MIAITLALLVFLPARDVPPKIARETTYFTEPVRPDGTIDYVKALEKELGAPVPPEQNALVPIVRALGPRGLGDPPEEVLEEVYVRLQMEPPADRRYLILFDEYMEEHCRGKKDGAEPEDSTTDNWFRRALRGPWEAEELPCVAGWLRANRKPLARIVQAVDRPEVYVPAVMLLGAGEPQHYEAEFVGIGYYAVPAPVTAAWTRFAVQMLLIRANLRLARDGIEPALRDLDRAYRLGHQSSQIPGVHTVLESGQTNSLIMAVLRKLALNGHLHNESMEAVLARLRGWPPPKAFEPADLLCKRVSSLHRVYMAYRKGYEAVFGDTEGLREDLREITGRQWAIDYNHLMRTINRHHDRVKRAMAIEAVPDRLRALKKLEQKWAESESWPELVRARQSLLGRIQYRLLGPAYRRSFMTRCHIAAYLPDLSRGHETRRVKYMAHFRLTRAALALDSFKIDEGQYPEELAELVPHYLDALPADPFAERPLRYRRTGDKDSGAVVYSVGENLKDDGGQRGNDDDPANGDLVARLGSARKRVEDAPSRGKDRTFPGSFEAVEPEHE